MSKTRDLLRLRDFLAEQINQTLSGQNRWAPIGGVTVEGRTLSDTGYEAGRCYHLSGRGADLRVFELSRLDGGIEHRIQFLNKDGSVRSEWKDIAGVQELFMAAESQVTGKNVEEDIAAFTAG